MKPRLLSAFLITAFLLAGCSAATPTVIPTLDVPTPSGGSAPSPSSGEVTASAEIVPSQIADLSFAVVGVVQEVAVSEGDQVQSGSVLASLGNLDQLASAVEANQQNLASAQSAYDLFSSRSSLALADAQFAVVEAQKRYDDALKYLKRTDYNRCDNDTIDLFFSRMDEAEERLKDLRDDNNRSSVHLQKIYDAQKDYDVARANYLYCIQYTEQEIAESNAKLMVAEAELKQAQTHLETLQENNGIDPNEAVRLQAAIANAQAGLDAARLTLDRAVLKAPFDGTIIAVQLTSGQTVSPGMVVITIANLDELLVETTDLSERDISRVSVGQPVTVTLDSTGENYPAEVVKIAKRASKLGGDVVYKVTIQLNEQPDMLLWGMSATARIGQ